jgi:putative pyruvate formate lyase activating enzyme
VETASGEAAFFVVTDYCATGYTILVDTITRRYRHCRLCPRNCGVDRLAGGRGFCGETAELRLAFAGLHSGEEPPLIGRGGSGTIFVSGCNLGCVFCQNYQISRDNAERRMGRPVSTEEFAAICLELQKRGAENINIVTGGHAIPAIVHGLVAARGAGLSIPALWNSSGYESRTALELLADHIDVYLPDLKTLDSGLAARFFRTGDYPRIAPDAILTMIEMAYRPSRPARSTPAERVIIRHLALPGYLDSTRAVLRWFAEYAQGKAILSLMTQYTPVPSDGDSAAAPQGGGVAPGRFLDKREYETVVGWLEEFGIEDGFCQELVTGSDWLPDFGKPNPFSSDLSVPVWHWKYADLPCALVKP